MEGEEDGVSSITSDGSEEVEGRQRQCSVSISLALPSASTVVQRFSSGRLTES